MRKYYYDLHIHSCLSPCADDGNTPNNLVGMASLCGLDILALTDHNTSKNCPAFFKAAERHNIIPIAGMELTTSEDIHVVCLFENLNDAMAFDDYVDKNRVKIQNKPKIFGNQTVLDENDEPVCEIEALLINASGISISDVTEKVNSFGGICYPAHIDREANGIIAILGSLPVDTEFAYYELHDRDNVERYSELYGIPKDRFIISSDSHYLTDMRDKENYLELEDLQDTSAIRSQLFKQLRRQTT